MRHRALVGIISILGVAALFGLFAALASPLSPPDSAYAQSNTPPAFPSGATTRDVDEKTPSYRDIGDPVTATDDDNDTLTYSLENAGVSHFRIDSVTGQLQTGAPLDHEAQDTYTVKVKATDPAGATDRITVTINVNDVDEPGTVSLSWRQPQVGTELTATLTDPDGDISGITWQWAKSNSGSKTANYTDISGETASTYTPVAADVGKYLRATASYTDGEGSGKSAEATSYQPARAVPSDNQAPVFDMDNSAGYGCPEDINADFCLYAKRYAPVGTEIYNPARATDPDRNDEIRYSLEGADANSFGIVPSNGYLVTKTPLNDAGDRRYAVTLKATDSSGASDTVTMTIRLSGGRWNPVVTGPERITYPENGTWQLAKYTAEVPDGPTHGWLINVEPGGGDGDFFHIDDDGVLTFRQPPDYEDPADDGGNHEYSFSIWAYDGNPPSGQQPGKTWVNVRVTVTNVDEVLEINGPTAVDYAEDRTDAVASYTVTGSEGPLSWELSGDDSGHFDISSGGELTFKTPRDYGNPEDADGDNAYLLSIAVTDGTETKKVEPVRVRVTDTNAPPAFSAETVTLSVPENTGSYQDIGEPVAATDPDEDDSLTYTWGGDDASSFDVLSYSGQVQTLAPLDYETRNSYSITVSVSDGKDSSGNADPAVDDTVDVTINVTDANDPPAFAAATANRTIAENTAAGENIGEPVAATDQDSSDTLTYSLDVPSTAFFTIDSASGQLQTKADLDHETKSGYTVTVSVKDSKDADGNVDTVDDDSIDVTITVTNADDGGTVTLLPTQPQVGTALIATLTDPDGAVSGTTWVWESSADGSTGWTTLNGASSTVTTSSYTPVAADVGKYLRAKVTYTDPESSGKSAEAVSANAVQAAPVANSDPEFPSDETGARTVAENTAAGENIGAAFTATDDDNDMLTYTLDGTDKAFFAIDTSTGQLQTKADLDYETKSSYTVTLSVRDSKDVDGNVDTVEDDSIDVTITVTNADDGGTVTLLPTQPQVGTALSASLSDPDGTVSGTTWQWARADTATGAFADITDATSASYTPVAADLNKYLRATASYTDPEGSDKSAEAVSTNPVQAAPVTNSDPEFPSTEMGARTVAENTAADQNIGAPVAATDANSDTLTYTTGGTESAPFTIISTSGQLQTKGDLDYETKSSYTVTVSVRDSKDADGNVDTADDDSIDVTITVTNADDGGTVTLLPTQPQVGTALIATLTDPDGAVSGTTWVWESSADGITGWTTLNGASSTVTTSSYTPVAADLNKYLRATVSYTDPEGSGKSAEAVSANAVQAAPVTNSDPEFPPTETGARTIAENTAVGENIGAPVTATDANSGDTLTYSIDGSESAPFTIISTSGQLQTKADLDHETKSSYTFSVSVHDGKDATGGADTTVDATINVTITVTDVNEAPEFPSTETGARSVAENTAGGEDIGAPVAATDDDNDTLTYTLGVADLVFFDIVEETGQLQTKAALDYEAKASYTVTVSVRDSRDDSGVADTADDDSIDVTITVTDEEEDGTVTLSLPWPQIGTELAASLSDPDGSVTGLTWQWASADTATGVFTDIVGAAASASYTPVDGDLGKYLQATASYDDGASSGKSASAVSANATNKAPSFTADLAARVVEENTATGQDIGTPLTATDADTLAYTLGGTDATFFSIIETSGQLQTKEPLNFEDKKSYEVTVIATDPSGATDTIEVLITVTNLDEDGTVTLSTVQPQVGTALTATLTDLDGEPSLVSWQWARAATSAGPFTNVSSGANPASYTPVAADLGKFLRATATYTDPQGSGKSAAAVSENVVQEAPGTNSEPVFSADTATRSVAENTAAETDFGTAVTATDANSDTLTYTLGGTDAASFYIVAGSGQLQTNLPLDYEDKSSYEVTVTATDPSDASDSITVAITVTNLDESGTVELSTVQPQVRTALTASLTDLDQEPSGVTWQWARGDSPTGRFTNVSSGANPASYTPMAADLGKYLRATASYTDRQGPGKSAIGVSVNPVQAAPATNSAPVFSADAATRSVAESAVSESNIGTPVTATDAETDTLTYTLDGDDAASFTIVRTSGQLQTNLPLDYEARSSYAVTVTATDPSGAADTIAVTITVTNVDEPGTVKLSAVQPQVDTALTATLTDPDGDPTGVTWQWEREDTPGSFSNVGSGTSYTPVAADVGKFLRATASYTDPQRANKSANGVSANPVRAMPTNNVAPVFSANAASRSVAENAEMGANIGTPVTATDANSDTLTYSLGVDDVESFSIVDSSGQLQTNAELDFEGTPSYTVTVTATDPSDVSDSITVTITVDNLDEAGTVTISPAQPQVRTALTATLDDPDGATTGVTWQWARENTDGSFSNISSGASYTPVALDVGKFLRATASYTDPHRANKSAHAVSANPVLAEPPANSDPAFSAEAASRSVDENTPANQNIGAPVTATDANNGDTLTYTLGGVDAANFRIVDTSGQLQTKDALDYEDKNSYTVTVSVGDSKDSSGTADTADDDIITVTISVDNVDEAGMVTLSLPWPQIGTELTASLNDPDGSVTGLTWQWASADTATGVFTDIVGAASASYTPVDGDLGKYLQATASYDDGASSGKSASAVSANPTNKAPAFSVDLALRLVEENTAAGQDIGTALTATDPDTLAYTLGGTDAAFFSIIETSGQLQTKEPLDYEARSSYEVTVTATDPSGTTDTVEFTIKVINLNEDGTVTLSSVQPQVGTALTAMLTDLDGEPSLVSWQWARADSPTGSYSNISSGDSYTPVADDLNKYLRATASYTDPQGSGKSADAVSANAVQAAPGTNSAPVFSADTATRSVAENTAAETDFGTAVTATDADTLTYTLGGTDEMSFDIVPGSGQLQTNLPLDHEDRSSYEVVVTATDPSGESDSITVAITVTNLDEAGTVELSAVQPQVGTALTASLTDPDREPSGVTWQWARGDSPTGPFTNVSSGANPASYTPVTADVDKYLRATASYTDRQGPGKSAIGVSANPVRAAPATNSAPVFSADAATRSVAESAAPESNIGTPVTATDSEADTLTYTLGGADVALFAIVNTSGQLQTKELLDFEVTPFYTVTVTATDPSDAADTITVTITVTNVDEPGTVKLSAVQPQVGTALTATLTDLDGATTGVTWQWARSGTDGSYSNVSSGASYTPAAADLGKFLRATASYTDPQRANKSANGVSANPVRAAPTNNVAPVFSANTATRSVAENAVPESNIGTPVIATDADTDTLTYTLGGNDAGSFSIVDTSGQLQTKELLDFEGTPSYTVTVTATDPSSAADTITVTITVINVDELGTVTISPAQPQVGTLLTATLDDPDGATTGVTWQWARSGANGSYSDISSGASYTPVAADLGKFLRATATYTDPQGSAKSAHAVSANPVLAEPPANSDPSFSAETATRSVNENTPANQNIGAPVAATDANNGDTLTYSLGGDDKASFSIVDTSGQLQTKAALDYEDKNSYTVTVSVRDSKDSSGAADTATDGTITVTISVNNVDEPGTATLLPAQPQVDTPLTASLSDPDGDPSAISWQWARADSATGTFADISGATSASYTPVNDDAEKYLRATASYTDPQGSGKSAAGVSGNAVQADSLQSRVETNAAPEFPSTETGARSVAENTAAGENIGAPVTATDADNDTLTYSLGGTDASSFTLVSTSGQLQTKDALDYETKTSYTVTVSVHDGKDVTDGVDTTVDDTITVTITVTNADEPGTVTLPPGQPRVDTGLTATLADPDGDVSDVTWKWESSSDGQTNWASISGATSETYAPEATDVGKYLQVNASYTDPQAAGKSASAVSSDPVLALPNTLPTFSDSTVTRSVDENTAAGQAIGAPVTGTDTVGDTLTYSLGGDDAAAFDIVGASGQLQTKTALDHETTPSYTVTVTATDTDGATAEVTVTINVTNVNEAPVFPDTETGARTVAENTAAGQDIGLPVAATDPDAGDVLTYSLDVTGSASFDIDEQTGQLQTKAALDHETTPSYSVTVTARDTDGLTTEITVTITVTNVNDAPVVAGLVTKNYPENGTATVATYTALDPENDNFTWRLSGVDAGDFAISGGDLTFSPSPDFEAPTDDGTDNVYQVTVEAFDRTETGILDVTVTVTNVNEPPAFPSTETGARSVVENTEAGQNIGAPVKATDPDSGDTLTYTLSGTDAASFDVVTTSGQLLTKDALNREAKDSHTVIVSVRDSKNASGATDTATDDSITVTITVTDENEPPVIGGESSKDYAENDTAEVATYSATDPDNGTIIWDLSGTDASVFFISATGVLTFKTSPDFEDPKDADTNNEYQVTVEATDGTNPVSLNVIVTVTNEDEDGTVTLSSVQPQVSTVLTATLSDPDVVSGNPTWQWAKADSAEGSFTTISTATTSSYTPVADDVDKYLQVTASYTDGEGSGKSVEAVSTNATQAAPEDRITNTPPAFGKDMLTRHIPENTEAGQAIGAPVTATDSEDTLTYSLDVTGAASFGINQVTGQLLTKSALDHETTPSYTVTVTAIDTFGESDTITVTIDVDDVNEAPEFPTETGARSVEENTAAGQPVGTPVSAVDPETGDTLTYSLGGTDAASFTIDELTGQISVGANTALDYETRKSYTVTVSVRDSKNASGNADTATDDTIDVTITVTNEDEPPVVTGPATPTFAENGTGSVAKYTATDPEGASVTWYPSGIDSAHFSIDAGVLTFKTPPDYEVKADSDGDNVYQVTISAYDGNQTETLDVSVTVTPENEAPVVSGLTSKDYPENGTGGVDTYTAIDPEGGSVTWSPLSGDDRGDFNISSTGALTFKTPPNFEAPADRNRDNIYLVTVQARDGTTTGRKDVSVTVTDVNERPAFAGNTATRSITENTAAGQNIGSPVAASDPDRVSGLNALTYSLGGTDAGSFTIVPATGQLLTSAGLNYETSTSYTVTVSVRDGKNASGNTDTVTDDTITVTINVTDRNEPPGKPAVPTVAPASAIGHTTLSVLWSAPSNTGPSISGYGVEYRKKGTGSWLTGNVSFDRTTATINNVIPDTDYEVRVRAKNDEGSGEWSDPGTGKTAVTPVNLQITLTLNYRSASYSVTEGSSRSIAVTLSAPADRALQVPITIANGTAETGDYQVSGLTSNDLSFSPGDSSRSFTIRAVSDSDQSNETVRLGFGNTLPDKVVAGARNTATVIINDDDRITTNSNNNDKGDSDDDIDDLPDVPDPRQSVITVSPPANRAPVFTEGVSTTRSVAEHTDQAIYIGEPVTATDADGDQLTYSLGSVVDGKSFAIDEVSGQLITRVPLDFETKPSYTVVVGVSDGRGASDAIVVTINLTDLQEVPITNPRTQAVGKVRPDAETTIETPDGAASVTFPVGSRENSYQVRVDSDASSCGGELPEGALRVSLTVEYFDNWGIQEYDVVLERPATVRLRLNAAELGGVDKVLAAHRRGGFSIYSHSGVAGEWSKVEFMLEDNDQGIITLTARGLRRLNCFAATTDAAAFAPVAQPVTENPTPEPTPRPTDQPTPEVEATHAPTSTAAPLEMTFPRALPVIVPYVPEEYQPTPPAISLVKEVAADSEPEAPETPPAPQLEKSGTPPLWPMLMMIAGPTLIASGGGLYLLARRRRWR